MQTFELFLAKNFRFFDNYAASAWTSGEKVVVVRTFCVQGVEGSIFHDFASFMNIPLV